MGKAGCREGCSSLLPPSSSSGAPASPPGFLPPHISHLLPWLSGNNTVGGRRHHASPPRATRAHTAHPQSPATDRQSWTPGPGSHSPTHSGHAPHIFPSISTFLAPDPAHQPWLQSHPHPLLPLTPSFSAPLCHCPQALATQPLLPSRGAGHSRPRGASSSSRKHALGRFSTAH